MKISLILFLFISSNSVCQNVVKGPDLSRLKTEKDSNLVNAYIDVGRFYAYNGSNDSAEYYFEEAIKKSEHLNYLPGIINSNFRLGESYLGASDYKKSMEHFLIALPIAEKTGSQKMIALIKRDIGIMYSNQDDNKNALLFYQEAELILRKLKDTLNIINLNNDMGSAFGKLGDTVKAKALFITNEYLCDVSLKSLMENKESIPRDKYIKNLNSLIDKKIILNYNLIDFLKTDIEFFKTINNVKLLQEFLKDSDNDNFRFRVHVILCRLYEKTKNYGLSIIEGNKALEVFDASEFPMIYYDISKSMINANIALGNYKEAYKYYAINSTIKDSFNAVDKLEVVKNLEMKYESEKKEQKILSLNKEKNTKNILIGIGFFGLVILSGFLVFAIRSKKLQRKLLIKEKKIQKKEMEQKMFELQQTALRAQMNPHFIFNSLNSVQRFVINNDAQGVNAYLSIFASLIRQTLENSGKPLISLKDELKYLDTYIKVEQIRANGNFDYEIFVENNIETKDIYIPNMIIQPFVENSILHGMRTGNGSKGKIKLTVSIENELILTVEDNGGGIKNTSLLKGMEEIEHESMGSSIIEKRIQLYNSLYDKKIYLQILDKSESEIFETGTKIIFKFPLSN